MAEISLQRSKILTGLLSALVGFVLVVGGSRSLLCSLNCNLLLTQVSPTFCSTVCSSLEQAPPTTRGVTGEQGSYWSSLWTTPARLLHSVTPELAGIFEAPSSPCLATFSTCTSPGHMLSSEQIKGRVVASIYTPFEKKPKGGKPPKVSSVGLQAGPCVQSC